MAETEEGLAARVAALHVGMAQWQDRVRAVERELVRVRGAGYRERQVARGWFKTAKSQLQALRASDESLRHVHAHLSGRLHQVEPEGFHERMAEIAASVSKLAGLVQVLARRSHVLVQRHAVVTQVAWASGLFSHDATDWVALSARQQQVLTSCLWALDQPDVWWEAWADDLTLKQWTEVILGRQVPEGLLTRDTLEESYGRLLESIRKSASVRAADHGLEPEGLDLEELDEFDERAGEEVESA